MSLPEIDLPKIAGVAGSAVGLIIATAIFLSWVTARYVPAFDRYRALTDELRKSQDQNRRRESLREQIHAYRRRLHLMSQTSGLLCWVMVCAVVTIATASAAMAFPPKEQMTAGEAQALKIVADVGVLAVAAALVLDVIAVMLVLWENRIDRRSIDSEAADLDELNGGPVDAPAGGGRTA